MDLTEELVSLHAANEIVALSDGLVVITVKGSTADVYVSLVCGIIFVGGLLFDLLYLRIDLMETLFVVSGELNHAFHVKNGTQLVVARTNLGSLVDIDGC